MEQQAALFQIECSVLLESLLVGDVVDLLLGSRPQGHSLRWVYRLRVQLRRLQADPILLFDVFEMLLNQVSELLLRDLEQLGDDGNRQNRLAELLLLLAFDLFTVPQEQRLPQ